jgi:outer membrane protein OmpA-like peptidoglycan-associated protein
MLKFSQFFTFEKKKSTMKSIVTCFIAALFLGGCTPPKQPNTSPSSEPVSVSSVTCNYKSQIAQAERAKDLLKLSELLAMLKRQEDCTIDDLDNLKRKMAKIAAEKASELVQRGELDEAEKWLQHKYAPLTLWKTQFVRGKIAAKRQQWGKAALFYNKTLDLIAYLNAIGQKPSPIEIQKLYKLASETQLLAGISPTLRDGEPSGIMRDDLGIEIRKRPIPVQFVYDKTMLTDKGKKSAKELVKYLAQKQPNRITLIGHTDEHGGDAYNCKLSKGRALALKDYLVKIGKFSASIITTVGKGEQEPFEFYDPSSYTQEEIDQINRRVEFAIDGDGAYTDCLW